MWLTIFTMILGVWGILSCLHSFEHPRHQGMAVGLMGLALVGFVLREVLIRWDRLAEQKWDVTKETKDNG